MKNEYDHYDMVSFAAHYACELLDNFVNEKPDIPDVRKTLKTWKTKQS